ncbi:MAG: hypothetical protein GWN67_09200 [Phycisphaerae bacterium]|nr:hypothetical protein [Phycisphaerae bacterium]NIP50473.1 hypothetical protein [Phycisphaerae bacterium]NIS51254.1 hypothetical protein [Phycisphaerae bacterium]NIU07361.1 hypothetical protein [Phycisphaerae bacterium]NIU56541.1 hypothetical protein [Phycisphaerae bacterium]
MASLHSKVSYNEVDKPFVHNMAFYNQAGKPSLQQRLSDMASLHSKVSCNRVGRPFWHNMVSYSQADMTSLHSTAFYSQAGRPEVPGPGLRQDNTPVVAERLRQSRPAAVYPGPWFPKGL